MCRKNWIPAALLLGFGVGMIVGVLFESLLGHLIVGGAAIGVGVWLLNGKCKA